jgi:hypothetical protein
MLWIALAFGQLWVLTLVVCTRSLAVVGVRLPSLLASAFVPIASSPVVMVLVTTAFSWVLLLLLLASNLI